MMGSTGFETGSFFTFWYKYYEQELSFKLENDNTKAVIAEILLKSDDYEPVFGANNEALKYAIINILEKNGKELFEEYNKEYLKNINNWGNKND